MISSSPISISSSSPYPEPIFNSLCARLNNLEKCVYGSVVNEEKNQHSTDPSIFQRGEGLYRRLEKLEKEVPWVSEVLKEAPPFRYSPMLIEPFHFQNHFHASPFDNASQVSFDSKVGLIQLHVEDLEKTCKEIQRIIDLEKDIKLDVLEDLQKKHVEMAALQLDAKNVESTVKNLSDYVASIVKLYSEQINALSEIFLSMDYFLRFGKKNTQKLHEEF